MDDISPTSAISYEYISSFRDEEAPSASSETTKTPLDITEAQQDFKSLTVNTTFPDKDQSIMSDDESNGSRGSRKSTKKIFSVEKPVIGGIFMVTLTKQAAWCGGKPNATYTALADGELKTYRCPSQTRQIQDSSGFTERSGKIPGNQLEFNSNFQKWSKGYLNTAKERGLDSITYLLHPQEKDTMVSIVEYPMLFTNREYVMKAMTKQRLQYGRYDYENEVAVTNCLLQSVSKPIREELTDRIESHMSFPEIWLLLFQAISPTSSTSKYDDFEKKIETAEPSKYKHEAIPSMTLDILKWAKELRCVKRFKQTYVLKTVDNLLKARGSTDFLHLMRNLKFKVKNTLDKALYMPPDQAAQYMKDNGVSLEDVIEFADERYHKDVNDNNWPPLLSNPDSKRPPKNYGANMATIQGSNVVADLQASLAQANALIQHMSPGGTSNLCHNCGIAGHFIANCPEKKNNNNRRPFNKNLTSRPDGAAGRQHNNNNNNKPRFNRGDQRNSGGRGGRGGGRGNGGTPNTKIKNWKHVAPCSGEPTTKVEDGTTWHWCDTCHRFNLSHTTEQHTAKQQSANFFVFDGNEDPSAWIASLSINNDNDDGSNKSIDQEIADLFIGNEPSAWVAPSRGSWPRRPEFDDSTTTEEDVMEIESPSAWHATIDDGDISATFFDNFFYHGRDSLESVGRNNRNHETFGNPMQTEPIVGQAFRQEGEDNDDDEDLSWLADSESTGHGTEDSSISFELIFPSDSDFPDHLCAFAVAPTPAAPPNTPNKEEEDVNEADRKTTLLSFDLAFPQGFPSAPCAFALGYESDPSDDDTNTNDDEPMELEPLPNQFSPIPQDEDDSTVSTMMELEDEFQAAAIAELEVLI